MFSFFGMKGSTYIRYVHLSNTSSSTMSLLMFCLEDLSIVDSGVLKSPSVSVLLSPTVFLIYEGAPMLCAGLFINFVCLMYSSCEYYEVSFWVSFYGLCLEVYFVRYKYCYPGFFFSCLFAWNIFSSLTLSVYLGLLF